MLHFLLLSPEPALAPVTFILLCESSGEFQGVNVHRPSGPDPCSSGQFFEDPIQRNPQVVFVSCRQAQHNGIDSWSKQLANFLQERLK